jgi:hypothetical protein
MMPLHLFALRNFAVGNLTTLAVYGGLGVATFFLVVFLQEVCGYSPIAADASLLPITVLISRRRLGPRVQAGHGDRTGAGRAGRCDRSHRDRKPAPAG